MYLIGDSMLNQEFTREQKNTRVFAVFYVRLQTFLISCIGVSLIIS